MARPFRFSVTGKKRGLVSLGFFFGFVLSGSFDVRSGFVGSCGGVFGSLVDGFAGGIQVVSGVFGSRISGGGRSVFGLFRASGQRQGGTGGGDENDLTHKINP